MINLNPKTLIDRLLKTADMPLLPGTKNVNKRNLHWIRFDRNSLTQNLSKLPEPVKNSLSNKLEDFHKEFQKFPSGELKKYAGMIWVLYADDRSITDDVLRGLKNEGGAVGQRLMQTAQFAQRNAIQLTSKDSFGKSNGQSIDKNIGSDYWLSMFGYAYQGLNGYNVIRHRNNIPRKVMPNAGNKPYEQPNGPLEVAPFNSGFRLVIKTQSGEVPAYVGQSVQNFAKYFKNENLFINKSVVYIPPSGQSNIVSSEVAATQNPDIDGGRMFQIPNQQAAQLVRDDPNQKKFIWGVYLDDDGVFFLQQRETFGGGAGGTKTVGDKRPMTLEQVNSIVNPSRIGINHVIFPGQTNFESDDLTNNDIVTGTKYVYTMDEETKEKIRNPNPENQIEWAVSSVALSKLKTFLEVQNFNNNEESYTAFEGFLLYMVGPVFGSAKNLGQGKATSRPLTTDPKYVSVQQDPTSNSLVSDRDITWVVLANRISEQRRLLNDRNNRLELWQKVAETDDLQEALDIMVSKASENGGSVPRISSNASSVSPAQRALEEASDAPSNLKLKPKPMPQPTQPQQLPQPQQKAQLPNMQNNNRDAFDTSLATSLIRRLTNNA